MWLSRHNISPTHHEHFHSTINTSTHKRNASNTYLPVVFMANWNEQTTAQLHAYGKDPINVRYHFSRSIGVSSVFYKSSFTFSDFRKVTQSIIVYYITFPAVSGEISHN